MNENKEDVLASLYRIERILRDRHYPGRKIQHVGTTPKQVVNICETPYNAIPDFQVTSGAYTFNFGSHSLTGAPASKFSASDIGRAAIVLGCGNRNHAKTLAAIADALIDGRPHLLVLPGAKAAGTHKDGASFRFGQSLFDVWLPGIARNQVPFVQPSLDTFLREPASQLLNGRFIGTAMRKKDVERHLGASLPLRHSWITLLLAF
jgi:hypothetical protein